MNFAFSLSSRKSERVAMRPALFQRKRRLQPLPSHARATQGKGWSLRLHAMRHNRLDSSITVLTQDANPKGRTDNVKRLGSIRLEPSLTAQVAKLPGADAVRDNSGRNRLPLAQG